MAPSDTLKLLPIIYSESVPTYRNGTYYLTHLKVRTVTDQTFTEAEKEQIEKLRLKLDIPKEASLASTTKTTSNNTTNITGNNTTTNSGNNPNTNTSTNLSANSPSVAPPKKSRAPRRRTENDFTTPISQAKRRKLSGDVQELLTPDNASDVLIAAVNWPRVMQYLPQIKRADGLLQLLVKSVREHYVCIDYCLRWWSLITDVDRI